MACRCWPSAWEDGDRLGHLASARGPWSQVRPHVRLSEGHRPPDNTTYGPRNIYVSVPPDTQNVLRFARNLRTYVRTKYVSSWGRAYNSGLVDSTHFCLADEAVKEKTITQRCSMYIRPYVLISIWAKKPAQRSAGTRGAHPIRYRSAFQLFVLLPIPGGGSMAPCGIARTYVCPYLHTYVRTYFPFLFFTVFQFWFLRRRMKARPSSNDIGHPTAAGECEEGGRSGGHVCGPWPPAEPVAQQQPPSRGGGGRTFRSFGLCPGFSFGFGSGGGASSNGPTSREDPPGPDLVLFRIRLGKWRPARGQGQGEALGGGRAAGHKARVNGEGGGGPTRATAAARTSK